MVNFVSRLSPHNCTECDQFEGNLEFRSDSEPDIKHYEEVIWIDCKFKGKRYNNNSLWVCNSFELSGSNESKVIRDTSFNSSMYRIYRRALSKGPDLESMIYDYVCRVVEIDPRGYNFSVCVHRIHKDLGISREVIFRNLAGMIESGYLIREQLEGLTFLRPPSAVSSISDILNIGKGR